MRCAVATSDDKVVPTNAGLLFFGIHPQEHLLQSDVACVLFRETVGASRYTDRRIIPGTLQELIDGAEVFLGRYIAVGPEWKGLSVLIFQSILLRSCERLSFMLLYAEIVGNGVRAYEYFALLIG